MKLRREYEELWKKRAVEREVLWLMNSLIRTFPFMDYDGDLQISVG
jgi:hypothetical protein